MSASKTNALPAGWAIATLSDICNPPQYGWTTSATDGSKDVKLLRSTDISRGTISWETVPFCEKLPPAIEKYQLHPGDIVITRTGAGVGNSLLLDDCPPSVFASYLIRFRPHTALSAKYIAYFLKSPSYRSVISQNAAGIAQPNVNAKKLASLEIPVAPRKTQDAIVSEIEQQFARVDAAIAALKRAQANLKRYRAAVLKVACEGRLVPTEAELARREGRSYEPASVLFEKILAMPQARWETAQRSKLEAKGKAASDESWKDKYIPAPTLSAVPLARLPEEWVWATTGQVGNVQLGRQRSPKNHSGTHMRPYLRVANVFEDRIDISDVLSMNFTPNEFKTFELKSGDILLNEGQSLELVGRAAIYRDEVPGACFQNTLIRFQPYVGMDVGFALLVFRSYLHNQRFQKIARWTTNIAHLGAERLSGVEFPIPPFNEQLRIVAEAERQLSIIKEVGGVVKANLKRADNLRRSILKQAFEGKLVPQNPTDEPAGVLLERIHTELETKSATVSTTNRPKKLAAR